MPSPDELVEIGRETELVNRAVDADLSESEQAELELLIRSSPKARQAYESLRELTAMLDAVPPENPPASLRPSVLDEIGSRARIPAGSAGRRRGRKMLFAATWAAAVVVIALLMTFLYRPSLQRFRSESAATMARSGDAAWRDLARCSATTGGHRVALTIRQRGEEILLDVAAEVPVTVSWDPARLQFAGFFPEGSGRSATVQPGRVALGGGKTGLLVRATGRGGTGDLVTISYNGVEVMRCSASSNF